MSNNPIVTDLMKVANSLKGTRNQTHANELLKIAQGLANDFDAPVSGYDPEIHYESGANQQQLSDSVNFSNAVADQCKELGVLVGFDVDNFIPETDYNRAAVEKLKNIVQNISQLIKSFNPNL